MLLKDKVAVVTGGGRDIGRAISIRLASEGAKVVINYFNSEGEAKKTLESVERSGGKGIIIKGDMTKNTDVEKLYQETKKNFGEANILINNTGGLIARKPLAEMTEAFYQQVFDLNFKSALLVSKAFIPEMKKGDAVVNISSQAARDGGGSGSALYASSKAALSTFTRAMAKEFGPKGIRVNAICPGMIDTLFHDMHTAKENREKVASSTPLRREGEAMDVADLVCFLASDQAKHLTGVNYDINGGFLFS